MAELRHFLGCSTEEAAEALGISKATVDREMKLVKAWLYGRVKGDKPPPES
jgi:DNA-directed RNA polymerase specialized sigma24 family protein